MKRYIQTQVECYWRACAVLKVPQAQREVRANAEHLLKQVAVMGATVKVRMAAINTLRRNGMPAPMVIGGPSGDAA